MAKTLISLEDLRARALAAIRQQAGCSSVQDIAINHVTNERAESNWSLRVVSFGDAHVNNADLAAIYVQHALRRDYDLLTDE